MRLVALAGHDSPRLLPAGIDLAMEVAALAAGDLDGDGLPELAVGTAGAGRLALYRWDGRGFRLRQVLGYFWSPLRALDVADLEGDGLPELLVLTGEGALSAYRLTGHGFTRFWSLTERVAQFVTADLAGDTRPEVALALEGGELRVLTPGPARWEPVLRAYPWGALEGLAAVALPGTARLPGPGSPRRYEVSRKAQLVVATEQKLVFVYREGEGGNLVEHGPFYNPAFFFDALVPGPERGLALGLQRETLALLELEQDTARIAWEIHLDRPALAVTVGPGGRVAAGMAGGSLVVLGPSGAPPAAGLREGER